MRERELTALLRPWLGADFLSKCGVCAQLDELLSAFDLTAGDIGALYERLSACLFDAVRGVTCGDMRVKLDDGRYMRVRVDDIDQMADEVLYLRLRDLAHNPTQCSRLRAYAMTHDSLAAFRALYVDFAAFQTDDELAFIARTVRACHDRYRWQSWLPAGS